MKNILLFLCLYCFSPGTRAATSITTPIVFGHWTMAGSPYLVYNDIRIPDNHALIIDAGVDVIFQGYYGFNVIGSLYAMGSAAQPINFQVNDTTGWADVNDSLGAWKGFFMDTTASAPFFIPVDSSVFNYCNITDVKDYISFAIKVTSLHYVNFYHNAGGISIVCDSLQNCEVAFCNFYDNNSINEYGILGLNGDVSSKHNFAKLYMHDCSIYHNLADYGIFSIGYMASTFENNEVYDNTIFDTISPSGLFVVNGGTGLINKNKIYNNVAQANSGVICSNNTGILSNNIICNNALNGGSSIELGLSNFIIRNNIIANNYSGHGAGGINIISASAFVVNNTIVNNSSIFGGINCGGISITNDAYPSHVDIKNNLFYDNIATGTIFPNDSSNLYVISIDTLEYDHNWSQRDFYADGGRWLPIDMTLLGDTSENTIGDNPGMIDPTLAPVVTESATIASFALLRSSPCINKGEITGAFPDSIDYAGNPRIIDGKIDIGAYESQYGVFVSCVSNPKISISVYPNPASNIIFVSVPDAKGTIELQDISGKQVAEKKVTNILTPFDIQTIPRGIYFATLNDGNGVKTTQKIVVE